MSTPNQLFTISRVCELTGLSPSTMEWLEKELGDELQIRRTAAGNRLFSRTDIQRLEKIKRLMDEGQMSLEDVKRQLFPGKTAASGTQTTPVPEAPAMATTSSTETDSSPETTQMSEALEKLIQVPVTQAETDSGPQAVHVSADDTVPGRFTGEFDQEDDSSTFGQDRDCLDDSDFRNQEDFQEAGRQTATATDLMTDESGPLVPPLPVESTVDLLLEAAEGLVQENLKLRRAVDTLSERCLRVESRLDNMSRPWLPWPFRRRR